MTSPDERARHWDAYETAELAAGRCPHSGLALVDTELFDKSRALMCGVCDCFGYPLTDSAREDRS